MKNMTKFWISFQHTFSIVLFIVLGWIIVDTMFFNEEPASSLEIVLQSTGTNRVELEEMFRHYQQPLTESLKYKTSCFLIENMPFYIYSAGNQLSYYKFHYIWLKNDSTKSPELIADSIKRIFGPIGALDRKRDIREVDSGYLSTIGTVPTTFDYIGLEYVQYLFDTCREVTDFGVFLLRSLGTPCAINLIPMSGSGSAGYFWLATWSESGEDYAFCFPGNFGQTRDTRWYGFDLSTKFYRYAFSVNRRLYEKMAVYEEELYPFWQLSKFKDVINLCARYYKKEDHAVKHIGTCCVDQLKEGMETEQTFNSESLNEKDGRIKRIQGWMAYQKTLQFRQKYE